MLVTAADPDTLVGARATVRVALEVGARALADAGVDSAAADAEWLLADVLGVSRTVLRTDLARTLASPHDRRYVRDLRRRIGREPLQHIVGSQAFCGITVRVAPEAMVPRPETEVLVEWALERLPRTASPLVLDVGTGTGCIACAIAIERPGARVLALELSPGAAALARGNVAALGLSDRVTVVESDLFAGLGRMAAHLIIANPPYLPASLIATLPPEVSRFDPRLALDGGADGLDVIRRIVAEAPAWLAPGGALLLETAGGEQARSVVSLMRAAGFADVRTRRDLAGVERFVAGATD
jgi:release factor glutamine methyltransferase